MQRYWVPRERFAGDRAVLLDEDAHHALRVMRLKAGDGVIVCDGEGSVWRAEIACASPREVVVRLVEPLAEDRELPVEVALAQSLPKGDKMDLILQKGTELGVGRFVPLVSARTVVKLDEKKAAQRQARWARIVKEAFEQSRRTLLPRVEPVRRWDEVLRLAGDYDAALLAYEGEGTVPLGTVLSLVRPGQRVLALIGPEGGFAPEEVQAARAAGFVPVSLGKRVLRTETAGLFLMAAIAYRFELMA